MSKPQRGVVPGQFVTEEKRDFARALRREMTPQEQRVWEAIRGRRLGGFKFRRQQVIDGYIADFYCDRVGIVLELDGKLHLAQAEYDAHRDEVIASRDLVVLRVTNERIDSALCDVLAELLAVCEKRAVK